jgi:hypothetical protein
VFVATGNIASTVDEFRQRTGANRTAEPRVSRQNGRREIAWDAAATIRSTTGTTVPPDFFNTNIAKVGTVYTQPPAPASEMTQTFVRSDQSDLRGGVQHLQPQQDLRADRYATSSIRSSRSPASRRRLSCAVSASCSATRGSSRQDHHPTVRPAMARRLGTRSGLRFGLTRRLSRSSGINLRRIDHRGGCESRLWDGRAGQPPINDVSAGGNVDLVLPRQRHLRRAQVGVLAPTLLVTAIANHARERCPAFGGLFPL